jgi:hypothetical protein
MDLQKKMLRSTQQQLQVQQCEISCMNRHKLASSQIIPAPWHSHQKKIFIILKFDMFVHSYHSILAAPCSLSRVQEVLFTDKQQFKAAE